MNDIPDKPASDIQPVGREKDILADVDNILKGNTMYWSNVNAKHENNYSKGFEVGKNHVQQEDLLYGIMRGTIKVIFEDVKAQINANEEMTFEKRQRAIVRVNTIYSGIINQFDMLKSLNFKLDCLSLQSILHGYTGAFLLFKANDHKD